MRPDRADTDRRRTQAERLSGPRATALPSRGLAADIIDALCRAESRLPPVPTWS